MVGRRRPLNTVIMEREKAVAVISIRGVRGAPQFHVRERVTFLLRETIPTRRYVTTIPKITATKTATIESAEKSPTAIAFPGCPSVIPPATPVLSAVAMLWINGVRELAPTPKRSVRSARKAMGTLIKRSLSCTFSCVSARGRARNVVPNALTKHAAARPPVRAREAALARKIIFEKTGSAAMPAKRLWKVSHSLTKPLNGGRPEMETAPMRKKAAVHGMTLMRPPYSSILRVCVAWTTDPAERKRSDLKSA